MVKVILASASPQRRQLLEGLGLSFSVIPSSVQEFDCIEHDPIVRARVLACAKVRDVAKKHPDAWIIGCDTLVVAPDGTLLEKPSGSEDAKRMIKLQSGGMSTVHSGLCLRTPSNEEYHDVSSSSVTFKKIGDAEMRGWISSRLWQGRSGAFQIDGLGQLLIERVEGDWTGVVGLPVFLFGELMRKAHAPFLISLDHHGSY